MSRLRKLGSLPLWRLRLLFVRVGQSTKRGTKDQVPRRVRFFFSAAHDCAQFPFGIPLEVGTPAKGYCQRVGSTVPSDVLAAVAKLVVACVMLGFLPMFMMRAWHCRGNADADAVRVKRSESWETKTETMTPARDDELCQKKVECAGAEPRCPQTLQYPLRRGCQWK